MQIILNQMINYQLQIFIIIIKFIIIIIIILITNPAALVRA